MPTFLTNSGPSSTAESKPECGPPFTCPDHCSVHWEGACPAECRCNILHEKCQEITCPADPPICIVYMRHDGCQDCACQSPFRLTVIKNKSGLASNNETSTIVSTLAKMETTTEIATFAPRTEPEIIPIRPVKNEDAELRCNEDQRQEILRNFASIDAEAAEIGRLSTSSLLFPPVFAYTKFELRKRCQAYKQAYTKTSFAAKRNCFNDYDVYIRTYYTFSYACGFGTELNFDRHFDCLQVLRFNSNVMKCQYVHKPIDLSDKRGLCVVYNELIKCVKPMVIRTCGWDGWNVFFEYLSVNAKSFSRSCRLTKTGDRSDESKISISDEIHVVDPTFKFI
uniref:Uncharacterized protein n=1 Tax=Romanomermis culicivorax TaxID=13658 RepID=A0A915KH12_ROMCU